MSSFTDFFIYGLPLFFLYVQRFLMNCFCHLRSVSGFIKVKWFNARSGKDLINANVILSFLENISFLFCKFRWRFRISFSFFRSSIEKITSFRFVKRMEKNDCSKLAKKLNIDLSYCNNMRFERTRMNYATPRGIRYQIKQNLYNNDDVNPKELTSSESYRL